MADEKAPGDSGAAGDLSLRGVFLTGLRLAQNRLQILATEIAEEKVRLIVLAMAAVGALFFVGLTVVLGAILLVVLYWETHRIQLLSVFTALSALVSILLVWITVKAISMRDPPFRATLAELKKDEDAWTARHGR